MRIKNVLLASIWRRFGCHGMWFCPIIPEKQLAFVAIPKNAGWSIRNTFGIAQGFISEADLVRVHKMPWPSVSNKAMIARLKYLGFLRFCVARNPWERFISFWQHKRTSPGFLRKNSELFHADMDFLSFVDAAFSVPDEEANRHYRSKVSFIFDGNKILVDRILRFENLFDDWEALRKEYDLPTLPHFNKTGAGNTYLEWYEEFPEVKELVTARYARDIEFFGYDFEGKAT